MMKMGGGGGVGGGEGGGIGGGGSGGGGEGNGGGFSGGGDWAGGPLPRIYPKRFKLMSPLSPPQPAASPAETPG